MAAVISGLDGGSLAAQLDTINAINAIVCKTHASLLLMLRLLIMRTVRSRSIINAIVPDRWVMHPALEPEIIASANGPENLGAKS